MRAGDRVRREAVETILVVAAARHMLAPRFPIFCGLLSTSGAAWARVVRHVKRPRAFPDQLLHNRIFIHRAFAVLPARGGVGVSVGRSVIGGHDRRS